MIARAGAHSPRGLVYTWERESTSGLPCAARTTVVLRNLEETSGGPARLTGRHVTVHNAGVINQADPQTDPLGGPPSITPTPLGDATPDGDGNFLFEPGRGGGRIDRVVVADDAFRGRYVQAARFGEVNVYHHIDRMAAHIGALLTELGALPLPRVTALVNAHDAAVDRDGHRDGIHRDDGRWVPFQGGHYRLPGQSTVIPESAPIARDGEIHLGPGQQLSHHGALARAIGGAYRANASHNPGIIFHEYAHHVTRHTADFMANASRHPERQSNRKTALDEGMADYWSAALLGTPDIWFFHHRHEGQHVHARSLRSGKTMQDYVRGSKGHAHANGTIWASALWDCREEVAAKDGARGATNVDRLILQALLLIGHRWNANDPTPEATARARRGFRAAALALLEADVLLYSGALRDRIACALRRRGIEPEGSREPRPVGAATVSP